MRNFKSNLPFFILLKLLFLPQLLFSQAADTIATQGIFDLLNENDYAEITIKIDLDSLLGDIRRTEYVKGEFCIERKKKDTQVIPVKARPRGKFRRMKCNFPPLKLKFKKDDLVAQGLNEFNEFKLVTQCLEDEVQGKSMIFKEYLAYKMFNELTPYSLRVQLVRLTFKHTRGSGKIKQWGILIEDLEDLSRRTNSTVVSRMGIPLDSLHKNQEKLASTFQYMIGNCDWSYILARNTEFIRLPDGQIMPLPYDFDYCGFVNAPYSSPNVQLGQKSVKDRVYLGLSTSYDDIHSIFSYFKTKESTMMKILEDCKQLDSTTREELKTYIQEFYALIGDEEKVVQVMFAKPEAGK